MDCDWINDVNFFQPGGQFVWRDKKTSDRLEALCALITKWKTNQKVNALNRNKHGISDNNMNKKSKKEKPIKKSKREQIIEEIEEKRAQALFEKDITAIREVLGMFPMDRHRRINRLLSLADNFHRDTPKSHIIDFVLLFQLLNEVALQYDEHQTTIGDNAPPSVSRAKILLYKCIWEIDQLVKIHSMPTPQTCSLPPMAHPHPNQMLVFENHKKWSSLLQKARNIMENEENLIDIQLMGMSDHLPPLKRIIRDHREELNDWQREVLESIESGESVSIHSSCSVNDMMLFAVTALLFDEISSMNRNESTDKHTLQREVVVTENHEFSPALKSFLSAIRPDDNKDTLNQLIYNDYQARLKQINAKGLSNSIKTAHKNILFVAPSLTSVYFLTSCILHHLGEVKGDNDHAASPISVAAATEWNICYSLTSGSGSSTILVGTPCAVESLLTCPSTVSGSDNSRVLQFDDFDWVNYGNIDSFEGPECMAIQRLMHAFNCPFMTFSCKQQFKHLNRMSNIKEITENQVFMNVKRYQWLSTTEDERLQYVHPIVGVATIDDLPSLKLSRVTTSFPSFSGQDCYNLWQRMKNLFPESVIEHLHPNSCFSKTERITMSQVKQYETRLKETLVALSQCHPQECQTLLDSFQIPFTSVCDSASSFHYCDLLLSLKNQSMLPAMMLCETTFDTIDTFHQLLGGLEQRQQASHPNYHTEMLQRAEELQRLAILRDCCNGQGCHLCQQLDMGDIDHEVTEPHPEFCFSLTSGFNLHELENLFNVVGDKDFLTIAAEVPKNNKRRHHQSSHRRFSPSTLNHALIRGLRRGIGVHFDDPTVFPSYQRLVRMLISQRRLSVFISDRSLSLGESVQRFCSVILTNSLTAQTMNLVSGHLVCCDYQSPLNVIYAGVSREIIRLSLFGNETFRGPSIQYDDTLILQPIISPEHCGFYRALKMSLSTVNENESMENITSRLRQSQMIMREMGFITEDSVNQMLMPNAENGYDLALLHCIWELRRFPHASVIMGLALPSLIEILMTMDNEEHSQETKFMKTVALLIPLIGGKAWDSTVTDAVKFHELPYFLQHDCIKQYVCKGEEMFASIQSTTLGSVYGEGLSHMVAGEIELGGTLFQYIVDQTSLNNDSKSSIKDQLLHFCKILRILFVLKCESKYRRLCESVLLPAFERIRCLHKDIIISDIDFIDVSSHQLEH